MRARKVKISFQLIRAAVSPCRLDLHYRMNRPRKRPVMRPWKVGELVANCRLLRRRRSGCGLAYFFLKMRGQPRIGLGTGLGLSLVTHAVTLVEGTLRQDDECLVNVDACALSLSRHMARQDGAPSADGTQL
jgi:hypothetical protein